MGVEAPGLVIPLRAPPRSRLAETMPATAGLPGRAALLVPAKGSGECIALALLALTDRMAPMRLALRLNDFKP